MEIWIRNSRALSVLDKMVDVSFSIAFSCGNRPKAEFYHSLLFCFGQLWKMPLWSFSDLNATSKGLYHILEMVDHRSLVLRILRGTEKSLWCHHKYLEYQMLGR